MVLLIQYQDTIRTLIWIMQGKAGREKYSLCFKTGVNFDNILRASSSYQSLPQSFFVLEVEVKIFGAKKLAQIC